jgi:predicted small secreted protein
MRSIIKKILFATVLASSLLLAGCSSNIGVGMSVGVPIGDHGYISLGGGSNRWY